MTVSLIDDPQEAYGGEPICGELPIAPSTFFEQKVLQVDPSRLPERQKRDAELREHIERTGLENSRADGARKVSRPLGREETEVARSTVGHLMRQLGLQGVVCGRKTITTVPDPRGWSTTATGGPSPGSTGRRNTASVRRLSHRPAPLVNS